jgi:hypothetical protein
MLAVYRRQLRRGKRKVRTMKTSCAESSTNEVVIKGFEGEAIEVTVEQLESRIVPQSSAGFLE